jgi:SAM-dependent methyltransferase
MHALRPLRNYGLIYCLHRGYQVAMRRPIRGHQRYIDCVAGKRGLEVGGPSAVFRTGGLIPLYEFVGALDNCNFSSQTIWAKHESGLTFRYSEHKPVGRQYLTEGGDLHEIPDECYEFVLSCHMLEHSANPLRALNAWKRILKPSGPLLLLLPNKAMTFDHKRPVTPLAHLIEDLEAGTTEEDLTHLPEILRLHDIQRDPEAGGYENFKARSERNAEFRGMHQHVFDPPLVRAMLEHANFSVELLRTAYPNHIIAIARKPAGSRVR